MSTSNFLRGTLIVTAGTFLVKFLGMIYVIPFYQLVGEQGGALYGYGYNQYLIFLSLATMGIPLAVSKFVAKYNALEQYEISHRMFRSAFGFMLFMGVLATSVLYALAPVLAPLILGGNDTGNTGEDVTNVIRSVRFALLLVPIMSVIRGFFQGHQSMGPTTASQIVEQIARIIFLLGGAFTVIVILKGTIPQAVNLATLAAFVGSFFGFLVLLYYWFKRREGLNALLLQSKPLTHSVSLKDMYKELYIYAIPFVFVGIAMPLYQQVDIFTFNRTMVAMGLQEMAEHQFSIFNVYAQKLVMIPVSLATAMGLTVVPAITTSYMSGEKKALKEQITKIFEIVFFLTLPAVGGLTVMASEAYSSFYTYDAMGANLLAWSAPFALMFALFSVTIAILQGLDFQKQAMLSLGIGILTKIILNIPLIYAMQGKGAVLATAIGFTISVLYNMFIIRKYVNYSYRRIKRRVIQTLVFTLIMMIGVYIVKFGITWFIDSTESKLLAILVLGICVCIGVAIYGFLTVGSGLAGHVLGYRFRFLNKK